MGVLEYLRTPLFSFQHPPVTPQLAVVLAIVVVLALLTMVSLVAGIAIAIVVLKATVGGDDKPPPTL